LQEGRFLVKERSLEGKWIIGQVVTAVLSVVAIGFLLVALAHETAEKQKAEMREENARLRVEYVIAERDNARAQRNFFMIIAKRAIQENGGAGLIVTGQPISPAIGYVPVPFDLPADIFTIDSQDSLATGFRKPGNGVLVVPFSVQPSPILDVLF
jgi:hypothetical protein